MSRLQRYSLRSQKQLSNNESSSEEEESFSLGRQSIMATVIELPFEEDPVNVGSSFDQLSDLINDYKNNNLESEDSDSIILEWQEKFP